MAKKLMNSANSCVLDGLEGLAFMAPNMRLVERHQIVVRTDIEQVKRAGKVTILCGGGAGHEPAHAGFVGAGMLSAAVSGAVFASPPPSDIEEALLHIGRGCKGGVLMVVTNYTGDRINFGIAAERARLKGIDIATVVVNEDTALESQNKMAGRRGLAGTVLVNKIAGAMAEKGRPLQEIAAVAQRVVAQMGTIGIALTPCVLPGASAASFTIPNDALELGLGIHGEAGARREQLASAREVAALMLRHLTSEDTGCGLDLRAGERVVVLLNNLGASSPMEMMTMVREVVTELENQYRVQVVRVFVGAVMTSLNMSGMSVTVLRTEQEWMKWIDEPSEAVAWKQVMVARDPQDRPKLATLLEKDLRIESTGVPLTAKERTQLRHCTESVCNVLMGAKDQLDRYDKECGDGDCGSTHARAADAISIRLDSLLQTSLADFFSKLSLVLEESMGGTSGGLYSLFFSAVAAQLRPMRSGLTLRELASAFSAGVAAIMAAGGAAPGDRTMLDAMAPFEDYLTICANGTENFNPKELVARTMKGCEATATMKPRAGRASYVGAEPGSVDPGASAFAMMVEACAGVL